jgi:hypothetical protein
MFGGCQSRSQDGQWDLLARRPLKPERLVRVIFKCGRAQIRRRVTRFECRDLALNFLSGCRRRRRLCRYWLADWERIRFGVTSSGPVFRARSGPHEVVDSAGSHMEATFFREYLGDVPISPTSAPKLIDEFTVRFKTRARRLDWQFGQNFLQVGVHCYESGIPLRIIVRRTPSS